MNRTLPRAASAALALLTAATAPALADPPPETTVARFRTQEIETGLTVGYAVRLTDMNADGKTDVLVIDSKRVVWYENPSWKQHTLLQGQTKPDNVCVAPFDVDRDGRPDLVLGADWTVNTREGGTLQWLKRPADPDGEWKLYPIAEEPTVHRVHTADLYGDGTPELILAPLHGRDSTRKGNWMD
ncbi:MAG TPA: VCBS repeat-containing protein, partial [Gemmataceae bacterium]